MNITINNMPLELFGGAKVADAIRNYYSKQGIALPKQLPCIEDRFGNHIAPDGELTDGNQLFIKPPKVKKSPLVKILAACLLVGCLYSCNLSKTIEKQVVILAVNDMHAAIDNFPKFAALIDSLRGVYPDMLLFAAGDNQTGNPVNDQYHEKGLPMIELMNAVGFNLSAVGNHEFDTHYIGFGNLIKKAKFDFVCANIDVPDSIDLNILPYKIITMSNSLKVGVLGLLHINQNGIPDSHPDNVKGIGFRSPFEVAQENMYLKDECDVFIMLNHMGFENDVLLAETLPAGVNLIIGGHTHTKVQEKKVFNGVMITQAENKLKYATLIKLGVSKDGNVKQEMELIDIRNFGSENQEIRAMVDRYNDNPDLNIVIATATDDFSSYDELGYLMADALRDGAKSDFALVNPGGVRIDYLPKGDVRIVDILRLDPFGNDMVLFHLTGHELKALMLSAFPIDEERPIYPSGLRTKLMINGDGNLANLELIAENGELLNMDKTYSVSMNSYMASVYTFEHKDKGQSLYLTTANNMIDYLKNLKTIKSYRGENRVEIKN
jgi:5'-nucleotidase / UDP-sugar diphosphatase